MEKLKEIIRNNNMSTRPEYYSGRGFITNTEFSRFVGGQSEEPEVFAQERAPSRPVPIYEGPMDDIPDNKVVETRRKIILDDDMHPLLPLLHS